MSDATVIMTVRHAATEFNHQRRYAGTLDVPLSADGVRDTAAAAQNLDVSVDVVISSPLKRALETARILVGDAQAIIPCDLCNERDYGKMQGLTSDEVESLKPFVRYIRIGGDFHSLNPPLGETLPALRRRAKHFADYVIGAFSGSKVLVVSHEVFLLQFHGLLRGETWQLSMGHRLPNLALTTLTVQDGRVRNETSRPLVETPQEDGSSFALPPGGAGPGA